ncbi:MAG: PilN domain-containing protein [Syntrophorhabdaceae bacterium]
MTPEESLKKIEKYTSIAWERAKVGITWSRDILTYNVLEGVVIRKRCLCAAIEKGRVSIAYGVRSFAKPQIKGFREYILRSGAYPTPEELTDSVTKALADFGLGDAPLVITVPRSWIIVKNAEFPAVVTDNLSSVIAYELDRLTPFTPSEAMYDFSITSEDNDKIRILLIVMRSETMRPYLNALREAGLDVQKVATGLTGFGTLCSILGDGDKPSFCMTVRNDGYEGCLVRNGLIILTASGDFTGDDREKNVSEIKAGIAPLVKKYEEQGFPPVVFVNASSPYTRLENEIGIPVMPVTREDMKKTFGIEADDSLTGSLGGLVETIWPGRKGFNLASKGLQAMPKNPVTRTTYVLLGLILIAMILYLIIPLQLEKARLDRIEYQISIRKNEVKSIEGLKQESATIAADMAAIGNFKETTPMTIDIMKELTSLLPKTVWLTRSRITGETVEIEGYAASATELLPRLEQSPLFRKVEFSSPTIRDTRLNADRFVMKMEIEGFEKKTISGAKDERKK